MSITFLTIGSLIVEIMRKEIDCPMHTAGDFTGPYPSGGSAIFIGAAARLGNSCSMVASVGDDAFGKCCLDRFKRDNIEHSMVRVVQGESTGCAFVSYKSDGSRSFIYHINKTGSSFIDDDLVNTGLLKDVRWLHLSYNTVIKKDGTRRALEKILDNLPDGAKISFDPNIRKALHMSSDEESFMQRISSRVGVYFPSEGEASVLTGIDDETKACRELCKDGKIVVYKQGIKGCTIFYNGEQWEIPSFSVDEVDPTGAGDCFAAGFLTALEQGLELPECGRFANAVGALAVTKKGPMEGAPTYEEVIDFLNHY